MKCLGGVYDLSEVALEGPPLWLREWRDLLEGVSGGRMDPTGVQVYSPHIVRHPAIMLFVFGFLSTCFFLRLFTKYVLTTSPCYKF